MVTIKSSVVPYLPLKIGVNEFIILPKTQSVRCTFNRAKIRTAKSCNTKLSKFGGKFAQILTLIGGAPPAACRTLCCASVQRNLSSWYSQWLGRTVRDYDRVTTKLRYLAWLPLVARSSLPLPVTWRGPSRRASRRTWSNDDPLSLASMTSLSRREPQGKSQHHLRPCVWQDDE